MKFIETLNSETLLFSIRIKKNTFTFAFLFWLLYKAFHARIYLSREEEEENDENERMWLCYDEDNARCISNFKLYTKYIYIYI